jgi:hypothetical protein
MRLHNVQRRKMTVEQGVAFDDETGHAAFEEWPVVLDVSCEQGVDVGLRGLSWAIVAIAARCADPAQVVCSFAEQLPIDLNVILMGGSASDSPQDRVTVSDMPKARH